jgi:UDP-N-acetylmuramate dehydrogenase
MNASPLTPDPDGLQQHVRLAPLTTIGIGGPARYFLKASDSDTLVTSLEWARAHGLSVFVLGGGSNLLISDEGFDGLVLQIALRGITLESRDDDFVMVKAAAGEAWDPFVAHVVRNGWAGVECLSGIPGLVGATPIQNVGAYGQDVSETIVRVEALDRTKGVVVWFTNDECRFGYRSSRFKNTEPDRFIILSVTFRLRRGGAAVIGYPELAKTLAESGVTADDLEGVRDTVIRIRKRKGMVIDPADPDSRSDGSFFMNPILTKTEFEAFFSGAPDAPNFPAGDGVKLSAAWLIEQAGFHKGFVHGRVGISSKHTLALINRGEGTAAEIRELVELIQQRVRERFGVEIHPEPNFIGF